MDASIETDLCSAIPTPLEYKHEEFIHASRNTLKAISDGKRSTQDFAKPG